MRRLPAMLLVALIVIGAFGAGLWWRATRTDPVSESQALAKFRDDTRRASPVAGPHPGVYTFVQRGHEQNRFGPLAINRDLPDEARFTVAATDRGYEEELALAEQHIEGKRFVAIAGGGRRATWRRNKITFLGVGRDDRKDITPPALSLPADLAVGATWTSAYNAGSISVRERSRVLRRATAVVAGRSHPVVVIRTVGDSKGILSGRRVDTVWWSTRDHLPLRWQIDQRLHGRVSLSTQTDLRLRSLNPRT